MHDILSKMAKNGVPRLRTASYDVSFADFFKEGASDTQIAAAEKRLGIQMPGDYTKIFRPVAMGSKRSS